MDLDLFAQFCFDLGLGLSYFTNKNIVYLVISEFKINNKQYFKQRSGEGEEKLAVYCYKYKLLNIK